MSKSVLKMSLLIVNDSGEPTTVDFASDTMQTRVNGALYPADVKLVAELLRVIREANRFYPAKGKSWAEPEETKGAQT